MVHVIQEARVKKYWKDICTIANITGSLFYIKYRGPILCVTSPALGSDDLTLDQSATSIQILPEPGIVM